MRAALLAAVFATLGTTVAQAQAPGWIPTGEWQCGPVQVVVSIDGYGAFDFFVKGAWFDNHYTIRRGQLFYNGIACTSVGNVWPPQPPPRKRQTATPYQSDRRCNDNLSLEDREKYCEIIGAAMAYDPRQMQAIARMGMGMLGQPPSPFQQQTAAAAGAGMVGAAAARSAGISRPTRVRTRARIPMHPGGRSRACYRC